MKWRKRAIKPAIGLTENQPAMNRLSETNFPQNVFKTNVIDLKIPELSFF